MLIKVEIYGVNHSKYFAGIMSLVLTSTLCSRDYYPHFDMILDIDFKIKLKMENKILKFINQVPCVCQGWREVWNERETMVYRKQVLSAEVTHSNAIVIFTIK